MPPTKPPYPPEFRAEAVRLAQSKQQPIAQTARNLGVSYEALRHWIKQSELDSGVRTDGLTTAEREELTRLRRENRVLREEREILKKPRPSSRRRTRPGEPVSVHRGGAG